MTSGQVLARRRFHPRLIAWAVASAVIGQLGCSQLQHRWQDRIGGDRFTSTSPSPAASPEAVPTPIPTATDPYAARVALDDRPPDGTWSPMNDRPSGPSTRSPSPSIPPAPPSIPEAPQGRSATPTPAPVAPVSRPEPTASMPTAPSSPRNELPADPAPDDLGAIDAIVIRGIARLGSIRNYRVSLERQERVRETLQPSETVTLNVRTSPFAVRIEWPEGPSKGREVLYSEGECEGRMHIKMPWTLIPIPPMQLEPDSPIALANARHPITEAGLLHILEQTREQVALARSGDPAIGTFSRVGPVTPEEFSFPCMEILRETPNGERWRLVVEASSSIPVLLQATGAQGQLLERYVFRDLQTDLDELDEPGAFDPAVRFGGTLALSTSEGSNE